MKLASILVALVITSLACSAALGVEIVPSSYVAPTGDVGAYTYYDDTGSQLTDGLHGGPWSGEPGGGADDPYEWVAWESHAATITFFFAQQTTFTRVDVFTGRSDGPSMYIPRQITLAVGNSEETLSQCGVWNFDNSQYPDASRCTLTLDVGGCTGSVAQITLEPTKFWMFLDEVDFYGTPVPEPSSLLALAGGIALLMGARRRRA
ncbi:MAG: PEP-CTERM sorting domain-containing protein [Armatimonadetes bacterium]|nr:PEP-CTERM sorting domain-containing protein [Armatimonadota bacterium]